MAEILTESFCERCGTRYTFQTNAPSKKRIGGRLKTISKGLKNYVLSDETTLEEAFADARSDEERTASTQQLEAFHQTFNFCMTCRQYTCANCWNEVEGRCLTCAPDLAREVLPQAFPEGDGVARLGMSAGAETAEPANGHDHAIESLQWPDVDLSRLGPPLESPSAAAAAPVESAEEVSVEPGAERPAGSEELAQVEDVAVGLEADVPVDAPVAAPAAAAEPVAPAQPERPVQAPIPQPMQPLRAIKPRTSRPAHMTHGEQAAAATAQTAELLARFRPGQSLDDAIAEYEAQAGLEDATAAATASPPEPAPTAEPSEPPIAALTPEPAVADLAGEEPAATEPVVPEPVEEEAVAAEAGAEPAPALTAEPVPAEAEPVAAEAVPAEPVSADEPLAQEPVAAQPAAEEPIPEAAEPVREPRKDDRVEAPVWHVVAPDPGRESPTPGGEPPAAPQWPAGGQWPTPVTGTPQWPTVEAPSGPSFAAIARELSTSGAAALWAASTQEVLAAPVATPGQTTTGVQACVSCGLPLSATARFCRRCGSRQA